MTRTDKPYDQAFFAGQSGRSLQSARIVLSRVFPLLRPRRVLDVGCGIGSWLRAALDLGATEVLGMDGDYVDRATLMIEPEAFIPIDLATPLQTALGERAATPFDLVICMEVAEHLPHDRAPSLVAELASLSDVVLFSAAVPFQYGTQHINEQWPEFWSILFRANGFACFDCLRADLWVNADVEWWYAQNALLFAREDSAAAAALPQEARAGKRGLSVVHPESLLTNLLGLPRRYRLDASSEELNDFRSLVAANLRQDASLPSLAAPARAAQAGPQARNVFPWTRTEIIHPDQELDHLSRQVKELGELLHAAEQACASALEALAAERTARLATEALARATQERLRCYAAARLFAEGRLSELSVTSALQLQELVAIRHDLAEIRAGHQAQAEQNARPGSMENGPDVEEQPDVDLDAQRHAVEPAIASGVPVWRVRQRISMAGRHLPAPVRCALRGPARLAWRTLRGVRRDVPPAIVSIPPLAAPPLAAVEPPPVEAAPEKPQIKCYDRGIGEVNWWTLAAAVTRLRRLEIFDGEDYLRRNTEVAAAGVDPYAHFIQSGALEGRGRIDAEELARVMSGLMLFDHAVQALPPPQEHDTELAGLVADIRHIGIYVSSYGNMFMDEIAEDLAADLQSVGVAADLLDENASIDQRPPVCLFVAPHEFFLLGRGPNWVRDDIFATGFMFGTEQVQTTWFSLALPFILMSRGMVDICPQTAALFERTGMAALHMLPGVRRQPHRLTERDKQHPLFRVLPQAAQYEPDPQRPFLERPIDIAFFGNSSPRRDRFFARNAAFLANYETFNYCRRSDRGPILRQTDDGALTRLAGHVSGHSKITLNIHREEFGYFEWHRMVRLGMCSGSLVVSDPCLPHPSFVANEHYLQENMRRIPDLMEWLLTTEDGSREAERVRGNVDKLITNSFDRRHTMSQMLRFLSLHRSRDGEASPG
jgi:SAM-dependent methyltransferase